MSDPVYSVTILKSCIMELEIWAIQLPLQQLILLFTSRLRQSSINMRFLCVIKFATQKKIGCLRVCGNSVAFQPHRTILTARFAASRRYRLASSHYCA
jgi:hypothetical protein